MKKLEDTKKYKYFKTCEDCKYLDVGSIGQPMCCHPEAANCKKVYINGVHKQDMKKKKIPECLGLKPKKRMTKLELQKLIIKNFEVDKDADGNRVIDLTELCFNEYTVKLSELSAGKIENFKQEARVINNGNQNANIICNGYQSARSCIVNSHQSASSIGNEKQYASTIYNSMQVGKIMIDNRNQKSEEIDNREQKIVMSMKKEIL